MKHAALAVALLAAACTTAPPPSGPVQSPATPLAGTPCDPPLAVPASIIASVRAQFDAPGTPRPTVPPEDMAGYALTKPILEAAIAKALAR